MVSPISVHHTPLPPVDTSTHTTPLFLRKGNIDTTSTASTFDTISVGTGGQIILINGPITIGQFADAVQLSIVHSHTTLRQSDLSTLLTNKKIAVNKNDTAQNLQALRDALLAFRQEQQNLIDLQNSQIATFNTAVNSYNNVVNSTLPPGVSDQMMVDFMNAGIANYSANNISLNDFNAIVTNYNTFINSRNTTLSPFRATFNAAVSTFQAQIAQNNAAIDALNAQGALYGIPPMPHQTASLTTAGPLPTQAYGPLPFPISPLPNPPSPMVQVPTQPAISSSDADFLSKYWQPLVQLALVNLTLDDEKQTLHQSNTDFNLFYIRGKKATQANAYSNLVPPQNFGTTGGISGGSTGVATSAVSTGLSSARLSGLIDSGIFEANERQFQIQMTQGLLSKTTIFGLQQTGNTALQAALPAIRLIGAATLPSANSTTAFGVAFGTTYAQIAANNVSSGAIRDQIAAYVNAELKGATPADINRAIDVLTAQANLFQLETALLVASSKAQVPGLVGQVFGNVNGITPDTLLNPVPQTVTQVIEDPQKQAFLRSSLISQLVHDANIQLSQAQAAINAAFTASLAEGPVRNADAFKQRILQQLVSQGVEQHIAVALAAHTQSILEAEITSQHIVNSNLFDQALATNQLTSQLIQAGYDRADARHVAEAAITQTQNNTAISNATEFQLALSLALENLNVSNTQAQVASQATVAALNVVPAGTAPLLNPFATTTLSPAELGRALSAQVLQTLTPIVGADRARQIADQTVSTIVGGGTEPGILQLINQNIEVLRRYGDPRTEDKILAQVRQFALPNIDMFAFINNVTNPAYAYLYTAATGISYTPHEQPLKEKRSIDIQV